MRDGSLDRRGKILVDLINDFLDPEAVPPFHQEFSVQQVIVDSVFSHTNPVNSVHVCHLKNSWKLGTMDNGIVP